MNYTVDNPYDSDNEPILAGAVLSTLEIYAATINDHVERDHIKNIMHFIRTHPRAFHRDHDTGGHVGASAVVINHDGTHILLTWHTVMHTWTFFGNHCDGDMNLVDVARARIIKDAGAAYGTATITDGNIFDVDIHAVPPHTRRGDNIPAHVHYDIAFLFRCDDAAPLPDTSQWFTLSDATALNPTDSQFQRIMAKLAIKHLT